MNSQPTNQPFTVLIGCSVNAYGVSQIAELHYVISGTYIVYNYQPSTCVGVFH